jgi:SynChlorMet cassette protein ScmC
MKDQQSAVGLSLANGSSVGLAAGDKLASVFISHLVNIMQLGSVADPKFNILLRIEGQKPYGTYEIDGITEESKKTENMLWDSGYWKFFGAGKEESAICILSSDFIDKPFFMQLKYIFSIIGYVAMGGGGLIVHGGLAEKDNKGIVFSGKSGAGKTTAINRLPDPWKPLSDDNTLIIRDDNGAYWAYPLPTRSRFKEQGLGGTWNVQHCVPLKGIFFLAQDSNDRLRPLDINDAIYLINRCASGAMMPIFEIAAPERKKRAVMQILDNSIAMARAIPAYIFELSLTGSFWNDVERELNKKILIDQENPKACHPKPIIRCHS